MPVNNPGTYFRYNDCLNQMSEHMVDISDYDACVNAIVVKLVTKI